MPRYELRNERGKVVGVAYGCSRGNTGALCRYCRRNHERQAKHKCAYQGRGGQACGVLLCDSCAVLDGDKAYCPGHRERAGLGPPPSVARHRERKAAKERRLSGPPHWIPRAYYGGWCSGCGARVNRGDRILYFPDRSILCERCGAERQGQRNLLRDAEAQFRRDTATHRAKVEMEDDIRQ